MGARWHFPPSGRLVQTSGGDLHLHIEGAGRPAVIFEAGIAATSLSWARVQPEIAKLTTAISYDRAGLGWSGPASTPRTPSVIARELKSALSAAGIAPPYILVGHSFGGLVAQRFAALNRADVEGVVLVDALVASEWCPASEERRRMLARGIRLSKRGALLAQAGIVGGSLRILLAGNRLVPRLAARMSSGAGGSGFTDRVVGEIRKLPRELWPVIAWHWSQAKNFKGMARHLESLLESAAEMMRSEIDPSIPVTALLAEAAPETGLPPHSRIVRAPGSGHWIQLDRPDLVIEAVRDLLPVKSVSRVSD